MEQREVARNALAMLVQNQEWSKDWSKLAGKELQAEKCFLAMVIANFWGVCMLVES